MQIPLVAALCAVTISVSNASEDTTWTGQRKALLRQEFSSISAATANRRNGDHLKKVEHDSAQESLRQPTASDTIKAELQLAAKDLQISPDETAQVVFASQAVVPPAPEATNTSLTDSVFFAAEMLGLSSQQVDHLKVAMANLDHRSYVHILQVLRAAAKAATTAATLSVPAKVAAVVTAAAKANYSAEEVGAAAAAASLSLADDAASTTVPLQGLADAVGQLGVEGQAAVVAAAGGESWRSQRKIAEMFQAISSTTPVFQWDSINAHPFGLDPEIVGDAVKDQMESLDIPEQEKMDIVNAAVNAAAAAERPNLRMNGTEGLDSNLAGDLLALAASAFSAGFRDQEVAIFKMKWQEMTSQQRAVAKRSFDALASARVVAGLRNLGEGNLSTNVASAVKAFEDAGASANDAAHVAAEVLRATRAANAGDAGDAAVKDKTQLQKTVEDVKSARLSDQQAQAILKVMAGFSPADTIPVATAWAAIGGKVPAPSTTQAPFPLQEEREKGQPRLSAPTTGMDLQALEDLNVVAFAALQEGIGLDLVDRADRIAKGMSPSEQMTAAAAIIRLPRRMSQPEGGPQVEKEVTPEEALANSPQEAGQAKVLSLLSTIYLDRKDFQEALESSQRASAFLGPPLDDEGREIVLTCINNQALAMAQLGSFGEAQQFLEEKLQKFRAEKNKRGEGQALFILAQLLQAKGSQEDALQRLALAAPALVESRDRRGEALAWQLSAKIHLEKNDLTKALPAAEMSSQAFRKVGDRRGRAQIAAVLAETQFSLCGLEKVNDGNLQEARRAAQESVSLFHDLNERSVEMGYSLHCLANINLALHDWDAALQAAQEALELFRSLQLPLLETTALLLESGAYLGGQDFERSQQRAMEAKEIYNSAGVLKGVDSVDQWLQNVDRYRSGEQSLKTFHGFSMRRKYNAPVSQSDERQNFRAPRRLSAMNDIELWMADDSKAGRSVIIAYQGLEHRAAGGPPPAGKAKVSAELHRLQFPDVKDMEHDVRWVHRRKSKSHSKGRRLQKAEEERLVAK